MVNSWGTTPSRPNGIFRVPMTINYSATASDSFPLYYWQTLNLTYNVAPQAPYLIGSENLPEIGSLGKDTFYLTRFQALQTGTAVTWKLKASGTGNVKLAVYSDNGGVPGMKLYALETPTPVVAGWNDLSMSYTFTGGTFYWLAYNSDANIILKYTASQKTYNRATPFAGFTFPAACDPYFSMVRNFIPLMQCYGALPVPPSNAPVLVSPGSTITFKWGQVFGATNYQLQISTASGFTPGSDIFNAEVNNVTTREVNGFSDNITYYWRVKGGNPYGWGPWSAGRQVVTGPIP